MGQNASKSKPSDVGGNLIWSVEELTRWEERLTHEDHALIQKDVTTMSDAKRDTDQLPESTSIAKKYVFAHTVLGKLVVAAIQNVKLLETQNVLKKRVKKEKHPLTKLEEEKRITILDEWLTTGLGNWDHARYALEWLEQDYDLYFRMTKYTNMLLSLEREINELIEGKRQYEATVGNPQTATATQPAVVLMSGETMSPPRAQTFATDEEVKQAQQGIERVEAQQRLANAGLAPTSLSVQPDVDTLSTATNAGSVSDEEDDFPVQQGPVMTNLSYSQLEARVQQLRGIMERVANRKRKLAEAIHKHDQESLTVGLHFLDRNYSGALEWDDLPGVNTHIFLLMDKKKDHKITGPELQSTINTLKGNLDKLEDEIQTLEKEIEVFQKKIQEELQAQGTTQPSERKAIKLEALEAELVRKNEHLAKVRVDYQQKKSSYDTIYSLFSESFTNQVIKRLEMPEHDIAKRVSFLTNPSGTAVELPRQPAA